MSGNQHCVPGEHVYDGTVFHAGIQDATLDKLKEIVFDDSDVYVVAYPKSGTTLVQEIVYLILSEGDFVTSDKVEIGTRIPFVELEAPTMSYLDEALKRQPPRTLKSHLPAKYFTKTLQKAKTKFVVVLRNPKDVLVSYYHFYRMNETLNLFPGTWDDFFEIFKQDRLLYGSYFEWINSWWSLRNRPELLFVKYEDILRNPHTVIRTITAHLGKETPDHLVSKIADRTSFKNMKDISTLNYSKYSGLHQDISKFMRKGEVGDWQNYFNEEQSEMIDSLYEEHCKANGLTFRFGNEKE